jgi:hypothetical protein
MLDGDWNDFQFGKVSSMLFEFISGFSDTIIESIDLSTPSTECLENVLSFKMPIDLGDPNVVNIGRKKIEES